MKLYVYDHCPYCVKARMIFGIKNVDFELISLLNDDEKTPIDLIGQKMLPILSVDGEKPMPESLDIVSYIDNLSEPMMTPSRKNEDLSRWLQDVRNYHYPLAMPRWVKMGLEEFATQGAVEYFTKKKEDYIGPFSEHLKKTDDYIIAAKKHLLQLENLLVGDTFFWGEFSEDDLHVFATLRCLTVVDGLEFPERINLYMNNLSKASGVPLHWDKAI